MHHTYFTLYALVVKAIALSHQLSPHTLIPHPPTHTHAPSNSYAYPTPTHTPL